MAKKNDKSRSWAEHLFVNEGYTQKGIAEYLDISEQTIGTWKKQDNWDEKRKAILSSPLEIKQSLLSELLKVAKGEKTTIDADALSKITKALDTLDDKISVQVIHSVFKEFDTWMSEEDPVKAVTFLQYHKKYLIHKINIDG